MVVHESQVQEYQISVRAVITMNFVVSEEDYYINEGDDVKEAIRNTEMDNVYEDPDVLCENGHIDNGLLLPNAIRSSAPLSIAWLPLGHLPTHSSLRTEWPLLQT